MTDHDALVRAICTQPDDDTPRLIYADYLDEAGESDRAGFVRAQVELARTPAWEPFAVACRHQRAIWSAAGEPFRGSLPGLPEGWSIQWHEKPFRRGLGWRVKVGSLIAWEEIAPWLFDHAPIGELDLQAAATLDDWRRFTAGDWLNRVRSVHLRSGSPVEPVRVLCQSPAAMGITDLAFNVSTSPGLPILVDDLLHTPLGAGLRSLSFRLGDYPGLEDLIDALNSEGTRFDRLTLDLMGLTPELIRRWCDGGGPRRLTELDLIDNYALGNDGVDSLLARLGRSGKGLTVLGLAGVGMSSAGAMSVALCEAMAGLRRLDLSRNALQSLAIRAMARSEALAGLRSLGLRRCQLGDQAVRQLTRARFWSNLVELDLRENPISGPSVAYLVKAPLPPDLTALLLDGAPLAPRLRSALRDHFGDRLILTEPATA